MSHEFLTGIGIGIAIISSLCGLILAMIRGEIKYIRERLDVTIDSHAKAIRQLETESVQYRRELDHLVLRDSTRP